MSNTLDRTSKEYIKTIFDVITKSFASINVTSDDTIDSYQKKIFTSLQANGEKLKSQLKEPTFDCVFDTYFK